MKQSYRSFWQHLPWFWLLGLVIALLLGSFWLFQGVPQVLAQHPPGLLQGFQILVLLGSGFSVLGMPCFQEDEAIAANWLRSVFALAIGAVTVAFLGSLFTYFSFPLWAFFVGLLLGTLMVLEILYGQALKPPVLGVVLVGAFASSGVMVSEVLFTDMSANLMVATLGLQGLGAGVLALGSQIWVEWQELGQKVTAAIKLGAAIAGAIALVHWMHQSFPEVWLWAVVYSSLSLVWVSCTTVLLTGVGKVFNGYWGGRKAFSDNTQVMIMTIVVGSILGLGWWLQGKLG